MKSLLKASPDARRGVVISGAYGMDNAGDDAVLTAIAAALRRLDSGMPVTVIARQRKKTARRFQIAAVGRLDVLGWLRAMGHGKLFISGGGSLLQNVTSRRSLWFYLWTIRAAKAMGCAVELYGCGVGPLTGEKARQAVTAYLNQYADVVCLRDRDSLALLEELGVTEPRLLLSADPALSLPAPAGEREHALGVVLRSWPGFGEHVLDFAGAARYAWERYHLAPVFICLGKGDREAAAAVCGELRDVPAAVTVDSRRTGRMTAVLSMRLHGLVFALNAGTPAAGVSYDPKVSAFCREAGLPFTEMEDVTADRLCDLVDRAAHMDGEAMSAAARTLREREKVNARAAAELLMSE